MPSRTRCCMSAYCGESRALSACPPLAADVASPVVAPAAAVRLYRRHSRTTCNDAPSRIDPHRRTGTRTETVRLHVHGMQCYLQRSISALIILSHLLVHSGCRHWHVRSCSTAPLSLCEYLQPRAVAPAQPRPLASNAHTPPPPLIRIRHRRFLSPRLRSISPPSASASPKSSAITAISVHHIALVYVCHVPPRLFPTSRQISYSRTAHNS